MPPERFSSLTEFTADGVHRTAHTSIDVRTIRAYFYVCSPYKFLGPHCGDLVAKRETLEQLRPDKLLPAPNTVPEKFELGTLPYEIMAGTTAAIDFLAQFATCPTGQKASRREQLVASMTLLQSYEDDLRKNIENVLAGLPGTRVHSRAVRRTPTLLVIFDHRNPQDLRRFLADRDINASAGMFYAHEPARQLNLDKSGGLRIGLVPYNTAQDVARLNEALTDFAAQRS